jgi:hypothetical protein
MLFRPYYESHVSTFFIWQTYSICINQCWPIIVFFDMGSLVGLGTNNLPAKYWFFLKHGKYDISLPPRIEFSDFNNLPRWQGYHPSMERCEGLGFSNISDGWGSVLVLALFLCFCFV